MYFFLQAREMRHKIHHCVDMNMTFEDFKTGAESFEKLLLDPEIYKYQSAQEARAEILQVHSLLAYRKVVYQQLFTNFELYAFQFH